METFSDGELEVNILTASTTTEYIRLTWELLLNPEDFKTDLKDYSVRKYIRLESKDGSIPVQADGEVIGKTPVEIHLVPKAVRILVPKSD